MSILLTTNAFNQGWKNNKYGWKQDVNPFNKPPPDGNKAHQGQQYPSHGNKAHQGQQYPPFHQDHTSKLKDTQSIHANTYHQPKEYGCFYQGP